MTSIHAATEAELADWDERTVDGRGGHVLQSLTWAEHRERSGWTADRLVFEDGFRVLALHRPWPLVGGWSGYVPRGPVAVYVPYITRPCGSTPCGPRRFAFTNMKSERTLEYSASAVASTPHGRRRSTASDVRSDSAIRRFLSTSATGPAAKPRPSGQS